MSESQFTKHFTLDEANALLPHVRSVFERVHEMKVKLDKQKSAAERLHKHAAGNGGSRKGAEILAPSAAITHLLSTLEDKGIIVKDMETGLIDFPHLREDEEVLLCWRLGEKEIGFWHDLESGFRGRQPL